MLSKSQYLRGLQCEKSLWLYNFRKDLRPETSLSLQLIFDQGHAIGELARKRFPGGTLITADYMHLNDGIEETKQFLKSGGTTCYEAVFVHDKVLVRPDILVKHGNTWDLIEVKGSTQIKDVYLHDISVQKYVLEGCGLNIKNAFIMHINNQYVRKGEIKPSGIFTLVNVNDEIAPLADDVKKNIRRLHKVLQLAKMPSIDIGPHCSDPYSCDFQDFCWQHIPEFSIYNIPHINAEKIAILNKKGILEVKDVPDDFPLSANQQLCVQAAKTHRSIVSKEDIKEHLNALEYPLHFLDFETINPALPLYDGMKPFQHISFQASLHVLKKPGGKLEHFEFLGNAEDDPRPALAEFLVKHIGATGTVIAYNAGFEGGRIRELSEEYPKLAHKLAKIRDRLWDLAAPFQKGHYVHPKFCGSYSIKKVLPVIVPGMTYSGMLVGNGSDAQIAYLNLLSGKLSDKESRTLIAALKKYCGQDTLAMVKILDKLHDLN